MKNLAGITVIMLMAIISFGQNYGEIQGKVVDEFGDGIPGVNVSTETSSGEMLVSTNKDGHFKLKPLASGIYNVNCTALGMQEKTKTGVKVDPDKTYYMGSIILIESAIGLPDAVVDEIRDKLIDPEETSRITMRSSDIKTNALRTSVIDMIATMKSDIKKGTDGELYFRGSRTGAVQYNIDGVKMTTDASRLPSSAIGSISVYTGGIPAKYGDTTGGVVVIETRSYIDLYNESKYSH